MSAIQVVNSISSLLVLVPTGQGLHNVPASAGWHLRPLGYFAQCSVAALAHFCAWIDDADVYARRFYRHYVACVYIRALFGKLSTPKRFVKRRKGGSVQYPEL
jgi:hypothetical protein